MNSNFKNESYFRIEKEKNIFIILRKISDDIIEKITIENIENKIFRLIIDMDDLSKKITVVKKELLPIYIIHLKI